MASVMLVAAVMVSMASGVLVAYGLCVGMFRVFRIHSMKVMAAREQATVAAAVVLAER